MRGARTIRSTAWARPPYAFKGMAERHSKHSLPAGKGVAQLALSAKEESDEVLLLVHCRGTAGDLDLL